MEGGGRPGPLPSAPPRGHFTWPLAVPCPLWMPRIWAGGNVWASLELCLHRPPSCQCTVQKALECTTRATPGSGVSVQLSPGNRCSATFSCDGSVSECCSCRSSSVFRWARSQGAATGADPPCAAGRRACVPGMCSSNGGAPSKPPSHQGPQAGRQPRTQEVWSCVLARVTQPAGRDAVRPQRCHRDR